MAGSLTLERVEMSTGRRPTVVEVRSNGIVTVLTALAAHDHRHLLDCFRGDTHGSIEGCLKHYS